MYHISFSAQLGCQASTDPSDCGGGDEEEAQRAHLSCACACDYGRGKDLKGEGVLSLTPFLFS